jgi:excisionase family DNA binding protein
MADDWITTKEAARASGYTADHIRDLVQANRIKAQKFGEVWQISKASILAYAREQKERGEKRGRKALT